MHLHVHRNVHNATSEKAFAPSGPHSHPFPEIARPFSTLHGSKVPLAAIFRLFSDVRWAEVELLLLLLLLLIERGIRGRGDFAVKNFQCGWFPDLVVVARPTSEWASTATNAPRSLSLFPTAAVCFYGSARLIPRLEERNDTEGTRGARERKREEATVRGRKDSSRGPAYNLSCPPWQNSEIALGDNGGGDHGQEEQILLLSKMERKKWLGGKQQFYERKGDSPFSRIHRAPVLRTRTVDGVGSSRRSLLERIIFCRTFETCVETSGVVVFVFSLFK